MIWGNTYSRSILNLHSFFSWLFWPWYSYSEERTRREYNNSQRLRTQTSSVSPSHSEITWNIWTIYTPRFSPIHLFVCVYCAMFWCFLLFIILRRTDAGFTFFLWSTLEKPTHNHLLISAQIPAPPAAWMVFCTFDLYFSPSSPALNATIQTCAGVSHPPVLSMQILLFLGAQMANKISDELKREGGIKKKWS